MFIRKFKLKKFYYFFKAINGMWFPPILFINIIVPLMSFVYYKIGIENTKWAEWDILELMFFLIPISSVWAANFVGELFFTEKAKDSLFFYGTGKRFSTSLFFYFVYIADMVITVLLHKYCVTDVYGMVIKLLCVSVFYYGLSCLILRLTKSAPTINVLLLILIFFNATYAGDYPQLIISYKDFDPLDAGMLKYKYIPLVIIGIVLSLASYFIPSRNHKKA